MPDSFNALHTDRVWLGEHEDCNEEHCFIVVDTPNDPEHKNWGIALGTDIVDQIIEWKEHKNAQ